MGLAELERLNEQPFLLYPDLAARAWTNAWWSKDILAKRLGKLSEGLGEDVELQFDIRVEPENGDWAYVATNEEPLVGSDLPINRMLVHLMSQHRRIPNLDWSIRGTFWSLVTTDKTELLRESLGPDQAHRVIQQGEGGMGLYPGVSVFVISTIGACSPAKTARSFSAVLQENTRAAAGTWKNHSRWS